MSNQCPRVTRSRAQSWSTTDPGREARAPGSRFRPSFCFVASITRHRGRGPVLLGHCETQGVITDVLVAAIIINRVHWQFLESRWSSKITSFSLLVVDISPPSTCAAFLAVVHFSVTLSVKVSIFLWIFDKGKDVEHGKKRSNGKHLWLTTNSQWRNGQSVEAGGLEREAGWGKGSRGLGRWEGVKILGESPQHWATWKRWGKNELQVKKQSDNKRRNLEKKQ